MATWSCTSCGGENPEGMKFCGHCGTPAAAPAPAPEPADVLRPFVSSPVAERIVETGGAVAEERRLITALFADISGFTALAQRVDTEQLLEIVDPIVSRLSSIVGRYEGYVEKFAGDALLALFGAPVTHEDDAERALRVAIEMHAELAQIREELPEEAAGLTLHVGINSGHGIARILGSEARMDYAVLGDSVILAQRLESQTPSGETYVGATTVQLARGRFLFEPVGELEVKGKAEPVPAWRLLGPAAAAAPEASLGAAPSRLLGRDGELAALEAPLAALADGRGGVVSIVGEPGVGKSTLVSAWRSEAQARAIAWLDTRCLSYGSALAYRPFAELVRGFAGIRLDDGPDVAAAALAAALARSGPPEALPYFARLLGVPATDGDADGVARLEPEAFRRRLHEAVASWLRRLAETGGVVVFVEDAHWADSASIALLTELATMASSDGVLLASSARPEAVDTLRPVLEAAGTDAALELVLHPLGPEAVASLVSNMLEGAAPPLGLVPMLIERTDGNPFFVEEVVRGLLEGGDLVRGDDGWSLRPGWDGSSVPPTVEGVLGARLDRLPARTVGVLQAAAVIGRRVRDGLLRGVLSAEADLDVRVDQLVSAGFLDRVAVGESDVLSFHHALVQDVAYSRLLRRQRRDMHRRVAEVAESLYGTGDDYIELLARHLYLGETGAKAIDYLVRAGERARRLFANQEAIVDFERAVEVARKEPSAADRVAELLLALADLHELRGDYEKARRLYQEVRDVNGDVRAWRGIASTHRRQGQYEAALALVDEAFGALDGSDLRSLWLERGWSLSAGGRLTDAAAALRAGLASAEEASDVMTGDLLVQLSRVESAAGAYRPALEHALHAQRIFEEHRNLRGLATALRVRGGIHHDLEEFDEAAAALRRALEMAERVGSVEEIGGSLINLGLVERDRGDLAGAIDSDRRAIVELERVGHATMLTIAYGNLSEKLVRLGDLAEAETMAVRTGDLAARIGHAIMRAQSLETLAEIRLEQDRPAEAAELAESAAAGFEAADALPLAAECLELAANALRALGDTGRAGALEARARSLVVAVG